MNRTNNVKTPRALKLVSLTLLLASAAGGAWAQQGFGGFPEQSGEAIYTGICQGCHMPDAKGAAGAGAYPALAGDKRLGSKEYPAMVVLRGQKAMPAFGGAFDDAQIANVVNYIRTSFGNRYKDPITPAEVKALRVAAQAR